MKKYILILIVCLLFVLAFAEEPSSMRSIATDNIFQGAWEDIFDPIDLSKIDDFYFFTNFADFSLKYNDEFGDISENSETRFLEQFPAGVAFTNPFVKDLKHSFFIRYQHNLSPDVLSNGAQGDYEEYVTTYSDITGDDVFDIKRIRYEHEISNLEDNNVFDFITAHSMKVGSMCLGLKFSSFNSEEEIDRAQSNLGSYSNGFLVDQGDIQTDYYEEEYELEAENYFSKETMKSDFSTKIGNKENRILLSLAKPMFTDSSIRFNLGWNGHQDISRDTNDKVSASFENIVEENVYVENTDIEETYKQKIEIKDNDIYIGARYKNELESSFLGEKGYWETGFNVGMNSGEVEESWSRDYTYLAINDSIDVNSEYLTNHSENNHNSMDESGDLTAVHFDAYCMMNLPLNEYCAFGFGGFLGIAEASKELDYKAEVNNVESFMIGSDIDTVDDYTQTETEMLTADKQSITKTTRFRVPIALEFKIPTSQTTSMDGFGLRNFVFRIGSTFMLTDTETENTYDVIEHKLNYVITEYGNGYNTEYHNGTTTLNSRKEIIKRIESRKKYSAGIGYKHSENVNIDLGGYYNYDSEDYFLGLSFTIKR